MVPGAVPVGRVLPGMVLPGFVGSKCGVVFAALLACGATAGGGGCFTATLVVEEVVTDFEKLTAAAFGA